MQSAALNYAKYRLRLLKTVHNDAYGLLHWFIWEVADAITFAFWLTFVLIGLFYLIDYPKPPTSISHGGIFGGVFFGKARNLKRILRELSDFDDTVRRLEHDLQESEAQELLPH